MPVLHDNRGRLVPIESTRKSDRPDVHPKGRVCKSCPAILSQYNGASTCGPCQRTQREKQLAKYRLSEQRVSYRRLMEEP